MKKNRLSMHINLYLLWTERAIVLPAKLNLMQIM